MSRTSHHQPIGRCHLFREAGFTLIELMFTCAIAVVLMFIAVPSMSTLISDNRQAATINLLSNSMNLARTEAIKRGVRVLVCPSSGCGSVSASSWQNGWQVCYDGNADNVCDTGTTSNPNPIRTGKVKYDNQVLTGPATLVWFNPTGASNGTATLPFQLVSSLSEVKKRFCRVMPAGAIQIDKG